MFNLLDLSILDLDLKYLYYLRIDPHELQNTFGKEERRVRLSSYILFHTPLEKAGSFDLHRHNDHFY
jgi:hypothetical protein